MCQKPGAGWGVRRMFLYFFMSQANKTPVFMLLTIQRPMSVRMTSGAGNKVN